MEQITVEKNVGALRDCASLRPPFTVTAADISWKRTASAMQFQIPRGFAHGFPVLSDTAEICYKRDDFWHPNDESGLAWNDPEIGIQWPKLVGGYHNTASAEGYTLADGTPLILY